MKNKKRRIILLNVDSDLYGANKVFFQVAQALKDDGHEILIFLPSKGPLTALFREHNLEFRLLNLGVVRRKYYHPFGIINRLCRFIQAYRILKKEALKWKADTIYSNTILIWVGLAVARSLNLKHIWHLHEILEQGMPKRIFGFFLSRNHDTFICVSRAVMQCWQHYFNRKSQCHLVYNGVKKPIFNRSNLIREELHLNHDSILIGLIGRINHWKGQSYFIDIARKINETSENVNFIIVGDPYPGNEYLVDQLNTQIRDYGLTNVYLLGFRKDVGNVLQSLDIFMLASIKDDPFPLVVLEAMSSGLPIIATKQGGAIEMLEEGLSGIFIPIDNKEVAAEKIKPLIDNTEERKKMGTNAQIRVNQSFSEISFRKNLVSLFK